MWRDARAWFLGKASDSGARATTDAAGNRWLTLPGDSDRTVILGGHLDSVPNGGWLDGCLGVLAGLEVLRLFGRQRPPVTLKLVDWADEEGARFGRSLLGSSAASGSLDVNDIRLLVDRGGTTIVDALRENGVELDAMLGAHGELQAIDARAYLELHIEQGPTLESLNKSGGAVLGTFGVERHLVRFTGQTAHSGSTPMAMRRDAFLAAAETALACREMARAQSDQGVPAVCTVGKIDAKPGIVTAIPGICEMTLDQRALDPAVLAGIHREAREASERIAAKNDVSVEWQLIWRIEPRLFDPRLIELCAESLREVTGDAPRLPSGALHDAAEMAPHMPVVMMFAYSSRGLSHCKQEDTPEPHLERAITAFLRLAEKTIAAVAAKTI